MQYSRWYSRYSWPLRFQSLICRCGPSGPRAWTVCGRQKGATTRKWFVAINTTPNTSIHFIQAFQSSTFNTRASNPFQDTIKASNLSKFHNWDKWLLVISDLREREWFVCYLSLLSLGFCNRAFFFPILILKTIVIKARDTKFVVVLVGSKWPVWLRRKRTRSKWPFERGKGLKETRSLWPPQRGVGLQEPNLSKTNHRVIRSYSLVICFHPPFLLGTCSQMLWIKNKAT
jgi:hypothetical protein